ncbi:MAG: UDP-N-acetylmuramate--L-alanine ligase [Spirochaeta sp.]
MLDFAGRRVHCVGIKGSGMAALTELMVAAGAQVTGSDVAERFFTDAILESVGVVPCVGFSAQHVPEDCDLVVYSAAYNAATNPELAEAVRRGLRCIEYPEALGELSAGVPGLAIAGTHGKTTTTGMLAVMLRELGLPGSAILGSVVPALDNRATYTGGSRFMAAETCEYRRHFLHFHPRWIILTNVESDHLDYYKDEADVLQAFGEFCDRLPQGGALVYSADDPGAVRVAREAASRRPDLRVVPYGFSTGGAFRIVQSPRNGRHIPGSFELAGMNADFQLQVPGRHNILNAAAVVAALQCVQEDLGLPSRPDHEYAAAAAAFTGTKRRSEIIGEVDGVLVMDDYGHHPTEIRVTIEGIREHYSDRRIVVDFMPHTFSRTEALWDDFLGCFQAADEVWLHPVFASAREGGDKDPLKAGRDFAAAIAQHPASAGMKVRFFESFAAAVEAGAAELTEGDLFLTMGAGNNYEVGTALVDRLNQG